MGNKCFEYNLVLEFRGNFMVVVRLSRGGAKSRPFFNFVVMDSRMRRVGKFIERLGFYNPKATANDEGIRINLERYNHWLTQGAQASDTVKRLIRQSKSKIVQTA